MLNEFESRVASVDAASLCTTSVDVLQLNVGLRCNMRCAHCHQSSSPDRTETMSADVLAAAIGLARRLRPRLIDVTGGAPELYPRIRELVAELRGADLEVQVRTNLTALLEPGCADLPALFARLGVRLLASLPSSDPALVGRQRGELAFAASVVAMKQLNALGYGAGGELRLDLAVNPDVATIPERRDDFEAAFRRELALRHGVRFDDMSVLTNVPIGRFGRRLSAEERGAYLDALRAAFNPAVLPKLACRTTLVVAWDGRLYDCDFNLGAGLPLKGRDRTVFEWRDELAVRPIAFGLHCYACAASAGSS
jgi:radical SAM/Cys-rich protein